MIPLRPPPTSSPSYASTETASPPSRPADTQRPNWLAALGAGFLVAVACAIVWGLISALTGYIFGIAAVFIGLAVAYAMKWGAKHITMPVIPVAFALTVFAVFLGDVLAWTLALATAGYDVGMTDVLAHYPDLLAISPIDALLVYVFGVVGAGAGAASLYREMRSRNVPKYYAINRPLFGSDLPGGEAPKFEVLDHGTTRATARITVPMTPPHTVVATYENMLGGASVEVDGAPFQKVHVIGLEKVMQVPLEGTPPHVMNIRFSGAIRPRIDVRLDGRLVGEV